MVKKISIKIDINNGIKAKNLLACLSELLDSTNENEIVINLKEVSFIAGNHLAVLGAIFDAFCSSPGKRIRIEDLSPQLKLVMRKNGFGRRIGLEPTEDMYHTTIHVGSFSRQRKNCISLLLIWEKP